MAGIFDFFRKEDRAISFQTVWGAGFDTEIVNPSGVNINQNTAFEVVAFWSAVSLISDTIATLPVDSFIRQDGNRRPYRPRPAWVDQPDVDMTRQAHYQQVLVSLLVNGNSYTRVFRNGNGDIVNLVCLDPQTVQVSRSALGRKIFTIDSEDKALTSEDIVHITDLIQPGSLTGLSRVERLKEALGLSSAMQSFAARFFGTGATTQGIIEFPGNLTPEQAKQLRDGFDSAHRGFRRAHKTGVLSGGATYKQTTVPNDAAQFLESRRFSVEEIARAFNIPLSMMGVPGAQSYASTEQNAIQFVTHTLRPYIEKLEWAYSRLLPVEAFLAFNTNGLLRGDFNSRISAYATGLQSGFMSVNDVRRLEDMSPTEAGDQYRVPLANIALTDTGLVAENEKTNMVKALIQVGFDPEATLKAFGLPVIPHTGVPSTQLQAVNTIDPENPELVYGV
jgi:HK97 family phage portal protein